VSPALAVTAILPVRDGDPERSAPSVPTESSPDPEILRCAETLEIPWRRLLVEEILSEQRLRRYRAGPRRDSDLDAAVAILGTGALRSWRVRDRAESLAMQARGSVRGALRRLRRFVRGLAGASPRDGAAFVSHLRLAHQRILLLQRVRRAAARSRGSPAERLAFVCTTARCAFDDAEWALREESSPRRGRRMEAAVRKVRDEGFSVPRAGSEAVSLVELRRIVAAGGPRGRGGIPNAD